MKMKLLAPAGDMESLKMALINGADEVYLGVKNFNARNIEGFSLDELKLATDLAHLFNARIFLAVNILFKDEELQSAVDLIVDAYNLGVDAFIVQDVGLISILHTQYSVVELHASTQMGIHNLEGVRFVERLGCKRVVLARETPLEEIKRIRDNSNIEIEYFCQGALCVSFSGNCYMSSYEFGASGNRGKCKQLCRLPYELLHNGKSIKKGYLLSAKDINMLDRLKDLEQAGVTSLKIEGRARRPYYVAVATKTYRNALDNLDGENDLKLAFNRGYTEGYFNGNANIISNIQNHIGVEIGVVKKVNLGKKFNEIFISTKEDFSAKSSLKFFRKGKEVATISAYDIRKQNGLVRVTSTTKVEVGDKVNLINDYSKEMQEISKTRKIDVKINFVAKENQPMSAKCVVGDQNFEYLGPVVESAIKSPLSDEEVKSCFSKSEYFDAKINCELGNVFVAKSVLNEFRRQVFESLKNNLTKINRQPLTKIKLDKKAKNSEMKNVQFVDKMENVVGDIVVFDPEEYIEADILKVKNKVENLNKKFVLNLPNFALKNDVEFLKNLVEKNQISIMVQNAYAFDFDTQKYIGGGMNVYNSWTRDYFGLSFVAGENGQYKMPYMTMRHCPMKEHINGNCANCPFDNNFVYRLESGKTFRLKRKKLASCTFYLTD